MSKLAIQSLLSGVLQSKEFENYAIKTALEKLDIKGISPEEALGIFRDSKANSADIFTDFSLDDAVAITQYVANQPSLIKQFISIAGVLLVGGIGYLDSISPKTNDTIKPIVQMTTPVKTQLAIAKFINNGRCKSKPCVATQIIPNESGYSVAYYDGDTKYMFDYISN